MEGNGRKVSKEGGKNGAISAQVPIYRVAGVEIDTSQACVRRGGEPVVLRPKTYRLLLYLLEHHSRLVSKDELVGEVWNGIAVSDDVLVHCVTELRKALEADPKRPQIIKTFPKLGYGLMAPVETAAPATAALEAPVQARPVQAAKETRGGFGLMAAAAVVILAIGFLVVYGKGPARTAHPYREVAWWKLDDARGSTAADASGHGVHGKITGGATWVQGKRGGALWFDGLGSSVSGRLGSLPAGNDPRSVTAWFQSAIPQVDDGSLFDFGSSFRGPTPERFFLDLRPNGRLSFGVGVYGPGGFTTGAGRWNDDAWHFVAATYSGPADNRARIYVDGELDADEKLTTAAATSTDGVWRIGMTLLDGAAFRGAIDDVRIYHHALRQPVAEALYRCSADLKDAGPYYYMPVFSPDLIIERRGEDAATAFRNGAKDYAGIQLARSGGDCAIASLEGADAGQDLRIAVDLLVARDGGRPTLAGPYFRSRLAGPGDGIIGGTSAGYWVQLLSTGMLKVRRLNPTSVVAFSAPDPDFDDSIFHHLEMEARGETLVVRLDGNVVAFDQGGKRVEQVAIPATWNGPPRIGTNEGAAGVAFAVGTESDRALAGGQRARNLEVRAVGKQ